VILFVDMQYNKKSARPSTVPTGQKCYDNNEVGSDTRDGHAQRRPNGHKSDINAFGARTASKNQQMAHNTHQFVKCTMRALTDSCCQFKRALVRSAPIFNLRR
jgi:hypothetical protein